MGAKLITYKDNARPVLVKKNPCLRAKYLKNVRTIAEKALDWKALGPVVAQYRTLLEKEIEADTRKLDSLDAFQKMTADDATQATDRAEDYPIRAFADLRRKFLMDYKSPTK